MGGTGAGKDTLKRGRDGAFFGGPKPGKSVFCAHMRHCGRGIRDIMRPVPFGQSRDKGGDLIGRREEAADVLIGKCGVLRHSSSFAACSGRARLSARLHPAAGCVEMRQDVGKGAGGWLIPSMGAFPQKRVILWNRKSGEYVLNSLAQKVNADLERRLEVPDNAPDHRRGLIGIFRQGLGRDRLAEGHVKAVAFFIQEFLKQSNVAQLGACRGEEVIEPAIARAYAQRDDGSFIFAREHGRRALPRFILQAPPRHFRQSAAGKNDDAALLFQSLFRLNQRLPRFGMAAFIFDPFDGNDDVAAIGNDAQGIGIGEVKMCGALIANGGKDGHTIGEARRVIGDDNAASCGGQVLQSLHCDARIDVIGHKRERLPSCAVFNGIDEEHCRIIGEDAVDERTNHAPEFRLREKLGCAFGNEFIDNMHGGVIVSCVRKMQNKRETRMRRIKYGMIMAAGLMVGCAEAGNSQDAATTQSAQAATPAPVPCQAEQYRQMDFWVGDWDLTWKNQDGSEAKGNNLITKDVLGDCVITENFNGAPGNTLIGISHSTYSAPHKLWRQTWVDNQGGYFSLYGGPQDDRTFILDMERLNDKGPFSRMVFEEIKDDSLVWRWQGKKGEADDWADQWVIHYARK